MSSLWKVVFVQKVREWVTQKSPLSTDRTRIDQAPIAELSLHPSSPHPPHTVTPTEPAFAWNHTRQIAGEGKLTSDHGKGGTVFVTCRSGTWYSTPTS